MVLKMPEAVPPVKEKPGTNVVPVQSETASSWELRLGEIAGQPEWIQSQEELEELADGIPATQLRSALDELSTDSSSAVLIVGRRLMWRWAGESPADAALWAAHLPDNNFGHVVCRELMVSWAEKDLAGAESWIRQQPDSGNKAAAELSLGNEAAARGQGAAAIALMADAPPSPERDSLLDYSVRQWATTRRDDAVAWLNQVSDSSVRDRMMGNVAVDWAVGDPVAAAGFAATAFSSPAIQQDAIVDIVRSWAASAPDDAAAWVEEFPQGPLRNAASLTVAEVRRKKGE